MQIKKYVAASLKEATQQMKNELGVEALILGTRVIENDKRYGLKKMYEITAGIDQPVKAKTPNPSREEFDAIDNFQTELEKLTKKIVQHTETKASIGETKTKVEKTDTNKKLEREIDEIADVLEQREVSKTIIKSITKHLYDSAGFIESSNLESFLLSTIASMIPTTTFKVSKNKAVKIALVGPTGVGKTTCIAKLAVISKIIHKLKVGLISIDTYRLGAIDQLRIFSEISDIEMAVAFEAEDIPKLVKKFKGKDLIFIDTVGRSQKAKDNLEQIRKYLDAAQVDETILVANATSSTRTLNDVAEKFKPLKYTSVIFSKIDEAVAYGNIMNLAVTHNTPVMFLTNGQVIPDDILSVNPAFLANLIFSGKLYK
ncbi:MAG: flagellar biosynthesis protein FlhF [Ignavibacteria bacterium]|nr:MAG: flagellar biosynthesis protein FlhF [Ignavibacteria bacterium]KAF0160136.1 MAG: flagellar biosynthesis protein FlhF [Ignavibacteria bacterium]